MAKRILLQTTISILIFFASLNSFTNSAHSAFKLTTEGVKVGTTYYGGHFDDSSGKWVIDNTNQCTRIDNGEFTAASLNAVKDNTGCDDDPGLGYLDDTPLHNRVSFAELSNNASNPDWSALGNLPAFTRIEIEYNGKCLIAEKLDVGTGGGPVNGTQRALDLWWQTARSIGFKNGFDTMTIRKIPQSTPLTPVGQTSTCIGPTSSPAQQPSQPETTNTQSNSTDKQVANSPQTNETNNNEEQENSKPDDNGEQQDDNQETKGLVESASKVFSNLTSETSNSPLILVVGGGSLLLIILLTIPLLTLYLISRNKKYKYSKKPIRIRKSPYRKNLK